MRSTVALLRALCCALWITLLVGCADEALPGAADLTPPQRPSEGQSCETGQTQACTVTLGVQGGVANCAKGVRRCDAGRFGDCEAVDSFTTAIADATAMPARAPLWAGRPAGLALSTPVQCDPASAFYNPCDPGCRHWEEDPPVDTSTVASTPGWLTGRLESLPTDLLDRAFNEPCKIGTDCQSNHQCTSVVTNGTCGHSKCEAGGALWAGCDPCVRELCNQKPECCWGDCGPGGFKVGGKCYYSGGWPTRVGIWNDARDACRSRGPGWDLASINDAATNTGLKTEFQQWATETVNGFWIGLRADTANAYAWSDGSSVSFNALPGYAASTGCGVLVPYDSAWGSEACSGGVGRPYICEGPDNPLTPPTPQCAAGEYKYGDSCYKAFATWDSWADARSRCRALGPAWDLAVIDSLAEGGAIFRKYSTTGSQAWIGYQDTDANGAYEWVNGSTHTVGSDWLWGPLATGSCGALMSPSGQMQSMSCSSALGPICERKAASISWTSECVGLVEKVCDVRCPASGETAVGECVPWEPGRTEPTALCATDADLAVGIPCDDKVPVCNHGNGTAPAGVPIHHFPVSAKQYPSRTPNLAAAGVKSCVTSAPIPPGECILVTGCDLSGGEREIVVNATGATGAVSECSRMDNWGISKPGVACEPLACFSARLQKGDSCLVNLNAPAGTLDATQVILRYRNGATLADWPKVADASACGASQGFYLDSPTAPTSARLCPASCTTLAGAGDPRAVLSIGCAGSAGPRSVERYESYQPVCPTGQLAQWGFLTWNGTITRGGTVTFEARLGADPTAALSAPPIALGTATAAKPDCNFSGGAGCPIDLYSVLGPANAQMPALRLHIVATAGPGSDAKLEDFVLSYSCRDSR